MQDKFAQNYKSGGPDSNRRPSAWEADVLQTELPPQRHTLLVRLTHRKLTEQTPVAIAT